MATILIIDDEEPIRALLRTALEAAGHEVMGAANGRVGLRLYRHRPADLVITDIVMSEMNGLDLILALTRQFLHAKVIVISGAGREKNVLDVAKQQGSAAAGIQLQTLSLAIQRAGCLRVAQFPMNVSYADSCVGRKGDRRSASRLETRTDVRWIPCPVV